MRFPSEIYTVAAHLGAPNSADTMLQQSQAPNPKRILVVDDEEDVARLVAYHLRSNGFHAEWIKDSTEVLSRARTFKPELIILDVMMPQIDGIQICRMIRGDSRLSNTAILFLSAKGEEGDRVSGFETGADDYVCKPFSPKELLLRVRACLRRGDGGQPQIETILKLGAIALDVDQHRVTVNQQPVELTATEFKLLRILMERKGRVQARDHLLLNVWNYETEIETRTVDTHVRRLREKLGSEASLIETVRGVGYRMVEPKSEACSI